jgi:hypothetical protein
MSTKYFDIIIIGSGMSGLYSAYNIKNNSPDSSFLVLEKYKKDWIGGRTSNEMFYGTEIVTGAGIGRKKKDKLLYKLLHTLNFDTPEFTVEPQYSQVFEETDIKKTIEKLKKEYKHYKGKPITFKQFASNILREKEYKNFLISVGYTDYENEDALDTLYNYGMDDNYCCYKGFEVPWQKLVLKLYHYIGEKHFQFSNNVVGIRKVREQPCIFEISIENGTQYLCNKVIVASTIDTIKKLLRLPIYNDIVGQPFLRLYAKFDKKSVPILKEYIKGYTIVPGPLQKIIPMDADKGVYMIAYSDNKSALTLKSHLKNTIENRELYEMLLEKALGIPNHSLHIIALKDFYWPIGTHYYKPLNKELYHSREEFIDKAQHPENGILVVGEVVAISQGWTEGALESVKAVLTKKWIATTC